MWRAALDDDMVVSTWIRTTCRFVLVFFLSREQGVRCWIIWVGSLYVYALYMDLNHRYGGHGLLT
jgi:hypothetical protein